MDRDTADKIINCLECGVVPVDFVQHFSAGREKEIQAIENLLFEAESGASRLLFIHGDLGIGKTHVLALTIKTALERKFMTSHITLSSRECPLSHLNIVYGAIFKGIRFTGQRHNSGFYSFLDSWLELACKRILVHLGERCKHGLTYQYQTCGFDCVNELYSKYIPELWEVGADFRSAVKLYQYADLRDNQQLRDFVIRWLLGEKLRKIDLRWMGKQVGGVEIRENISNDTAFLMLRNVAKISKILGLNGLVILLDEAERIPSINRVTDGYINLIRLMVQSKKMPGVLFICATTPQFYDDARTHLKSFESEETKEALNQIYRRMEEEKLMLSSLPADRLEEIARKIIDIYGISTGYNTNSWAGIHWEKVSNKIRSICAEQQTMREFVGRIMEVVKAIDN